MTITMSNASDQERDVDAFIEFLMRVPLAEWLAAATMGSSSAIERAEAALRDAIVKHNLAWRAWEVRDAVATAWYRFECADDAAHSVCRAANAAVRVASERAALALLARPYLGDEDFGSLFAGFRRLWPIY